MRLLKTVSKNCPNKSKLELERLDNMSWMEQSSAECKFGKKKQNFIVMMIIT